MNTHHVDLVNYRAKFRGNSVLYLGTAGSHGNEQLEVALGEGWAGLTVQVIFHPSEVAVQLPADGLLDIPWEATAEPLTAIQGRIVFQGFSQDRLVNTIDLAYTVAQHSAAVGRDEEPYTPGIVEGVLNRMAADKEEILGAARQADQAQKIVQQTLEKVEDTAAQALENIAAAAPALPTVSSAAAGQSVTVRPDGAGYQLAGPFLPAEAGIRPTVSGNPAVCRDSLAWSLQGLKVYGKSTQNGIPSPENPVPIASAGDAGSIELAITDGENQVENFTFSTPDGLPGLPAESGGNYTDENGQQWICDVADFETHRKETALIKVVLTSDMASGNTWEKTGTHEFRINASGVSRGSYLPILCNCYRAGKAGDRGKDGYIIRGIDGLQFFVCDDRFGTVEQFTQWLDDRKAAGNPVVCLVERAEHSFTDLPAEECTACATLTTCTGTTVVSAGEQVAGIEARYLMDGAAFADKVGDMLAQISASGDTVAGVQ